MLIKLLALCNVFYAPNDLGGGPSVTDLDDKALNSDSIYDALGDDSDEEPIELDDNKGEKKAPKEPVKETKKTKIDDEKPDDDDDKSGDEEDDEEVDELAELEEELEGPKEEQLELTTPVRRREILQKYPNLFKDFPYLEKAYYREQQFTEIYPTIDDAKTAQEKSQTLDNFESELMKGNSETILKAIKDEDQNAFHRIVDNYMVALWNTDQVAYHHVIANINKTLIASLVTEGKRINNEALLGAATILQQYIFGGGEWAPPSRLAKDSNNPEKNTLDQERQQFAQQRFETARDDLNTRLGNALTATIDQNIDPKNAMTSYVKRAASEDAMRNLQRLMSSDTRFQSINKRLWEEAAKENFSKSSVDRIKAAWTSKAKTLLPTVLKKARIEALKGLGKRVKDDTEDINDGSTRNPKTRNTTSSSNSGRSYSDKAKQIPKGMSTYDFLNSD